MNKTIKQNKKLLKLIILTSIIFVSLVFAGIFGGQIYNRIQGAPKENNKEDSKETLPTNRKEPPKVVETVQDKIKQKIQEMTLEEKVAQLFIITPEALTSDREVTVASDITKASLETYPVGGLIYFSKNITSRDELKTMLANTMAYSEDITGLPIFLSIDEEGGDIARIGNSGTIEVPILANMSEIGLTGDIQKAYEVGMTIGTYLSELGFNLDYAPVADVLTNPENIVVKKRSFGSDPKLVSQMILKEIEGMNEEGIYGTLKHFPGHGATKGDTHEGYAYTNETLEQMINDEMLPFIAGIENKVSFIMVGHISVPGIVGDDTPSSLSKVMLTDILRNKLGFEGIIITDALNMGAIQETYSSDQAAIKAFQGGADLLLMPADFQIAYEGIMEAVSVGEITEERINESLERILKVKFEMME